MRLLFEDFERDNCKRFLTISGSCLKRVLIASFTRKAKVQFELSLLTIVMIIVTMIKVIVYLNQLHFTFFIKKFHLPFVFIGIFFLIFKLRTTFRNMLYSEIVPVANKFNTEWVQFQFSQLKRGEKIPTRCVGRFQICFYWRGREGGGEISKIAGLNPQLGR